MHSMASGMGPGGMMGNRTMRSIRDRLGESENLPIRSYLTKCDSKAIDSAADSDLESLRIDRLTWFQACANGSATVACAFILGGIDVNVTDIAHQSVTGLHYAAARGDTLVGRILLDNGANINAPSSTGVTPLMVALQQGRIDMVSFLCERGADYSLTDDQREPCLFYGATQPMALHTIKVKMGASFDTLRNAKNQTLLHVAAAATKSRYPILYLCENSNLDPNEKDNYGDTPLHFACRANDLDGIKALMSKGASPTIANNDGIAPPNVPSCKHQTIITKINNETNATTKERLTTPDYSNWANLDAQQLKHFLVPFLLPNTLIVIASYMSTIFAVLALLGSGVGFTLVAQFAMKQRRRSLATAGFFSGALVYGSVVLVLKVFPTYEEHHPHGGIATSIWWVATFLMYLNYARAVLADPGVVKSSVDSRREIYDNIAKYGEQEAVKNNYDLTSMVLKPLRAKHCTKTNECVYRFDHFCVWTGNAIGGGNHRPFVLYCLCQLISQICVMHTTTSVLFYYGPDSKDPPVSPGWSISGWNDWLWNEENTLVTVFLLFYNSAVILFVSAIITSQLWYATRNVTSNEVWFADRYRWMMVLGSRAHSYFDQGTWNNLKEFFWSGNLCAELHTVPPMSEHLLKATRQYAAKMKSMQEQGGGGAHGHSHGGGGGGAHGHSHGGGAHGHSHGGDDDDHGGHSHGGQQQQGGSQHAHDPQRQALSKLFEATAAALDPQPASPSTPQGGPSPSEQLAAAQAMLPPETQNEMQVVQAMLQRLIGGQEPDKTPGLTNFAAEKREQMVHQAKTMHQHYTQAMSMMQAQSGGPGVMAQQA